MNIPTHAAIGSNAVRRASITLGLVEKEEKNAEGEKSKMNVLEDHTASQARNKVHGQPAGRRRSKKDRKEKGNSTFLSRDDVAEGERVLQGA